MPEKNESEEDEFEDAASMLSRQQCMTRARNRTGFSCSVLATSEFGAPSEEGTRSISWSQQMTSERRRLGDHSANARRTMQWVPEGCVEIDIGVELMDGVELVVVVVTQFGWYNAIGHRHVTVGALNG